ncbi:MAG: hypothetical protein ACKO7B_05400, partial [Flavobacteriales bacterium]
LLSWSTYGKKIALVWACAYYLLALFSKESSVSLAVIGPMLMYVHGNRRVVESLRSGIPFFLLTLLFVAIRLMISQVPDGRIDLTNDPYLFVSPDQKIATISVVLLEYVRLILLPQELIFDYGYRHIPYGSFADPIAVVSALLHLYLLVWGVLAVWKRNPVGFFFLSYLLGILLLSNLVLNVGPVMADRFAFFPSFFFIGGVLLLLVRISERFLPKKEIPIISLLLLIVVPFAYVKSAGRVREWKDNLTLYRADLDKAPNSFRVLAFNAMEEIALAEDMIDSLARKEKFRYGIGLLERAYAVYPDYKNMYKEW